MHAETKKLKVGVWGEFFVCCIYNTFVCTYIIILKDYLLTFSKIICSLFGYFAHPISEGENSKDHIPAHFKVAGDVRFVAVDNEEVKLCLLQEPV